MLFLLINYPPIYSLLWMVAGVIGFFLNKKIKNEMMNCLNNYQLFHFFGATLFALFTEQPVVVLAKNREPLKTNNLLLPIFIFLILKC